MPRKHTPTPDNPAPTVTPADRARDEFRMPNGHLMWCKLYSLGPGMGFCFDNPQGAGLYPCTCDKALLDAQARIAELEAELAQMRARDAS